VPSIWGALRVWLGGSSSRQEDTKMRAQAHLGQRALAMIWHALSIGIGK